MNLRTRYARKLAWCLGALLCTSCGNGRVPVYPVTGKVLMGGKPLPRATLVFHPTGDSPLHPVGTVDDDGSFQLTTYDQGDGAPAGKYQVTVEWRRLATINDDRPPANSLPARYARPDSSGLLATIAPGENVLPPFELTRGK
jgi:hypothetical protein